MKLVVVESPAKAKTINKYLGDDYVVLASFGHVRDLPPRDGSVRPDDDFAMEWQVEDRGKAKLADIAKALRTADSLFLATDPDREGEAISWHICQALLERRALKPSQKVERVVFNEVTRQAVSEAFANPRAINQELVDAYLARRALDYLVGFTLSPILWRKLPGSRSAGRVQSVALRLICDREAEIEAFIAQEYWSIDVDFLTPAREKFRAHLTHLGGKKLDKLSLGNEGVAHSAKAAIAERKFAVSDKVEKQVKRNPSPPFITSTLQQDANRKLGFSASRTMKIAQTLYEGVSLGGETVGLITYMRTDGLYLSNDAIAGARAQIKAQFGDAYVPASARVYKSKQKNAQEAHEAIRPTDFYRTPDKMARLLERDQARLYELIWKRAMACQMESAVLDQVAVDIFSDDRQVGLRANGSVVKFPGFLALYRESRDEDAQAGEGEESGANSAKSETSGARSETDGKSATSSAPERDDLDRLLPPMRIGDALATDKIHLKQSFTEPPPRFTEASLVKKLEELGIGRPSTYASIIDVLQNRNYVRLEAKKFIPEDRGRVVTAFLTSYFARYVETDFTAKLEDELDDVSGGRLAWKDCLRLFWKDFSAQINEAKDLTITQVIDHLDEALGPHFFPQRSDGSDSRVCPSCHAGRLGLKLGRTGGFIGCSRYPDCRFVRSFAEEVASNHSDGEGGELPEGVGVYPRVLGQDPKTGQDISLRKGPYGLYVQLGEAVGKEKPRRASLSAGMKEADLTLASAINLLALPRDIGLHPESGEMIAAGIGRFGPYLKHGTKFVSLPKGDDVLTIGMNRAVDVLAAAKEKAAAGGGRFVRKPIRELGQHPADQAEIGLYAGQYGPYLQWNSVRVTVPKTVNPEQLTTEQAIALLATKQPSGARASKPAKTSKSTKAAAAKPSSTAKAKKTASATKTSKAKTSSAAKPTARRKSKT